MTYKLIKDLFTKKEDVVVMRKADKALIPFDDANTDYIKYKAWLEAGNTPEEAD